jgi:alpha-tubulin suppressor-like RCC1 family protein
MNLMGGVLGQMSWRWMACASALAVLVACGGGGNKEASADAQAEQVNPVTPATRHVVTVIPGSVRAYWGHSSLVQASVKTPSGESVPSAVVAWASADTAVAVVTAAGTVVHGKPGETTLSAGYEGFNGQAVARTLGFNVSSLRVLDQDNCALSEDGKDIWCWGKGDPIYNNRPELQALLYPNPVRLDKGGIPADAVIGQVAPGIDFSCAVAGDDIYCWGSPGSTPDRIRGMGTGSLQPIHLPQKVAQGAMPIGSIQSVKMGRVHTACALTSGGVLACWGDSSFLMKSETALTDRYSPPWRVHRGTSGTSAIQDFALGNDYSCILTDGKLYCANNLPSATFEARDMTNVPHDVQLVRIKSGAGTEDFMGMLGSDGWLYVAGTGFGVRMGTGSAEFNSDFRKVFPIARGAIPAGAKIIDFAIGGVAGGNCVVTDNGKAYCWGNGYFGSLGDGNMANHDAPVPVEVLQGDVPVGVKLVSIECGRYHCTAMGSDRLPYAWGYAEAAATGQIASASAAVPRLVSRVDLR